ncbi:MAG: carbon storage regulator CsrA [Deltaproteobacteria bacterium]|nr:carbon storage regulator CsrA [Deltaproteobacteria bacterium]
MLVLTRKSGEGIMVGDNVKIIVLEAKENQIKIGIEAPIEVPVHREEIYLKIQEENKMAATAQPADIKETLKIILKKE